MPEILFPPFVTSGFFDSIAAVIPQHAPAEPGFINDLPALEARPTLLCIGQGMVSASGGEKLILDVVDGTVPPRFKAQVICGKDREVAGKFIQLSNYKLFKSRQRIVLVDPYFDILQVDATPLLSQISSYELQLHPGFMCDSTGAIPAASGGAPTTADSAAYNQPHNATSSHDQGYMQDMSSLNPRNSPYQSNPPGSSPASAQTHTPYQRQQQYNYADSKSNTSSTAYSHHPTTGGCYSSRDDAHSEANRANLQQQQLEASAGIKGGVAPSTVIYPSPSGGRYGGGVALKDPYNGGFEGNGEGGGGRGEYSEGGMMQNTVNYGPVRSSKAPYDSSMIRSAPYSKNMRSPFESPSAIDISDLTLYTPRWMIRARCTNKSNLRSLSTPRWSGKLFTADLLDKTGAIRASFFGNAAEKWYSILSENKMYSFSKGQIKNANTRYNSLPHTCEITFDEGSIIHEMEDQVDIPRMQFDFVPIKVINDKEAGSMVDLLAVVSSFKIVQQLTLRNGQQTEKRDITLLDSSGFSISLTMWGEKHSVLSDQELAKQPIIAVKGAKIGDWQGRKLDTLSSTRIEVATDDIPGVMMLRNWWKTEGSGIVPCSITVSKDAVGSSQCKSIEEITKEASSADALLLAEKGLVFNCRAAVERINEDKFSWPACPDCKRKMIEQHMAETSTVWVCAGCSKSLTAPNHTYMLNMNIVDSTGSLKCSFIGDKAEELMGGTKATTLIGLQDDASMDEKGRVFHDVFMDVCFTEWIFRIQAKSETYMDATKTKYKIFQATSVVSRLSEDLEELLASLKTNLKAA